MADLEQFEKLLESGIPTVRVVHDHDLYCIRSYKYHPVSRQVCNRPLTPYCLFPCCSFLRRDAAGRFRIGWTVYQQKKKEIRINKKCRCLIVASEYMKGELLRNGFDPKRIRVVPPGLPVTTGRHSNFSPRNLIVFTGQIIRGKGVDLLLEALARIKVPFECLIAGDGNHRPFCEEQARALGLVDRVRFGGFMPREELDQAYAEASVAVISSVWPEPFGLVGLESMRFGLPIVGFDAGGISEWLIDGHNGYLVPAGDCARFADAVERLLLDKDLGQWLGQKGARLLVDKYDLNNYVSGLEALFTQQVTGKTARQVA
jgi:glycosyltransferase involved in cell wall biosynthesis